MANSQIYFLNKLILEPHKSCLTSYPKLTIKLCYLNEFKMIKFHNLPIIYSLSMWVIMAFSLSFY